MSVSSRTLDRLRFCVNRRSVLVGISVLCVLILLVSALPPPDSWKNPGLGLDSAPVAPSSFDYPYAVQASWYPAPSNFTSVAPTGLPQLISFGYSFGLLNASLPSSGGSTLWFSLGTYSPTEAAAILSQSPCLSGSPGNGCVPTPTLPIQWANLQKVGTLPGRATGDALVVQGTGLIAAASYQGGGTNVFVSSNSGESWTTGATGISGTSPKLATDPEAALLTTINGGNVVATTLSLTTGAALAASTLNPPKSGGSIQNATALVIPTGSGYVEGVAATENVVNAVAFACSSNQGATFSWQTAGAFNTTRPSPAFSEIGQTMLYPNGGLPGQVAGATVGNGVLLLATSNLEGRTVAETFESPNGCSGWQGPYFISPSLGAVVDPTLAVAPSGLVYASWRGNGDGSLGVYQAILLPDGRLLQLPAAVPGTGGAGISAGAPSLAIDLFHRPLLTWAPASGNQSNSILYGGGFLTASNALEVLQQAALDPLYPGDFNPPPSGGSGCKTESCFNQTVTKTIGWAIANATNINSPTQHRCAAQNVTVLDIYSNISHVRLSLPSSLPSPPVCNTKLVPNAEVSPLLAALGPEAPNTYLATLADGALEALGVPVTASPLAGLLPLPGSSPLPGPLVSSNATSSYGEESTVAVSSIPWSPTAINLSVQGNIAVYGKLTSAPCDPGKLFNQTTDAPTSYGSAFTVQGTKHTYWSSTALPSVYLTNLTPYTNYSWTGVFTVNYTQTWKLSGCESGSGTGGTPIGPKQLVIPSTGSISGYATTSLGIVPGTNSTSKQPAFIITVWNNQQLLQGPNAHWNNSMLANANPVELFDVNTSAANFSNDPAGSYLTEEDRSFSNSASKIVGNLYNLSVEVTSRTGGWIPSGHPLNISLGSAVNYPAQTAPASCSFLLNPPSSNLSAEHVSQVTASGANVTWFSNGNGIGYIQYYQSLTGLNLTESVPAGSTVVPGVYRYTASLHALAPWATYEFAYGVETTNGCVTERGLSGITTPYSFNTLPDLWIFEQDLPYDSVTKTGGGAQAYWYVPWYFLLQHPAPSLVSAGLVYNNTSATVSVPESTASIWDPGGGDTFFANFTPVVLNSVYSVALWLNYTGVGGATNATSQLLTFTYLKETTSDGLTDLEKANGWFIPVSVNTATLVAGALGNGGLFVGARASQYSTNGLIGDYVEKEFDLDPYTVDTAESGMLDTWNLTFNLGLAKNSPTPPSGLQYWYENSSSYNPFSMGSPPSAMQNITNLTPTAQAGPTSGDGSSWAAKALWSVTAFRNFLNLTGVQNARTQDGVPLRAVTGTWKGIRTVTVWGKLSWGANPLVASTVFSSITDGARIDPVANRSLEISSLWANSSGLNHTTGWAVEFTVRGGTATSGPYEIQSYSQPALGTGTPSSISNYSVAIPVTQTYQKQTLQAQVIANESGKLVALNFNGSLNSTTKTLDMLYGTTLTYPKSTGSGSTHGQLSFKVSWVRTGLKTPTYMWLPSNNGTTNGLPLGLERYTGEQAFDLVVVNVSANLPLSGVPYPWSASPGYTVSLSQGLNNFLVPREQFLNSTFGEAILRGVSPPYATGANPPLIVNATSAWSSLHALGGSNLMTDLASYWQNRAIWNSVGAINSATEKGTPDKSSQSIHAMAVDGAKPPANNTGGNPGDPTLENTSMAGAALQAVLTLNITNTTQLQLLLAGLVDNTTGGVNGTFQLVTLQVPFLGLDSPVVGALANQAVAGQGLYGTPKSAIPSQTSPSSGLWGALWNAYTALTTTITQAVVSLIEVAWSATVAAFTYINHLFRTALALGGTLLNRTAAALETAGTALVKGLNALLTFIIPLLQKALSLAFGPLVATATNNELNLNNTTTLAEADVQSSQTGYKVTNTHARNWYGALGGQLFEGGIGLGTALAILLTVIAPFSIGPLFLATLIIPLLIQAALQALEATIHMAGSIPLFSSLTASLVSGIWSLTNATIGASNYLQSVFFAVDTQLVADLAAGVITGTSLAGYLFLLLYTDGATAGALLAPGIVFGLAFFALLADILAHTQHSKNLGWIGAGLGASGGALGGYYGIRAAGPLVGLRGLDLIGAALSTYAFLAGLAVVTSPTE
ncbi:MAG: ECF transporter S component [Thermoplasmata archaeon]